MKLDTKGKATVVLPPYFQALNRDFRYQLTCVGSPAPNLHCRQGNCGQPIQIACGPSRARVSWQVTGVRKDRWAEANPIAPEERKPAELLGCYLHPQLFGKPESKSISRARNPKPTKYIDEQAKLLNQG